MYIIRNLTKKRLKPTVELEIYTQMKQKKMAYILIIKFSSLKIK